jgi:hypothetical protein
MCWVLGIRSSCDRPPQWVDKVTKTGQTEITENFRDYPDRWSDTLNFEDSQLSEQNQQDDTISDPYGPQESLPGPLLEHFLLRLTDDTVAFDLKKIDDSENFLPHREVHDKMGNIIVIHPFMWLPQYDENGDLLYIDEVEAKIGESWKINSYVSKLIFTMPGNTPQEMLIAHEWLGRILSLHKTPSRADIQKFFLSCLEGIEVTYPTLEEPSEPAINLVNKYE